MITINEASNLAFEDVKNAYDKYSEEVERAIRIAAMDGRKNVMVPIAFDTATEQEALCLLIDALKENGFYATYNDYGYYTVYISDEFRRRMKWEVFVSW